MPKYVFAYSGGGQPPSSPEEQEAVMGAWMGWFGALGEAVVDGGNPFGPASTVTSAGITDGGTSSLGGYSIVSATSLAEACEMAKGCPQLSSGGSVEVYETFDIG